MKSGGRFRGSAQSALWLFALFLVIGTAWWLTRVIELGALNIDKDAGPWTIPVGLAVVVLVSYVALAALGYRVSPSGRVNAPRKVTWIVVGLTVLIVMGSVFALLLKK